MKIQKPSELLFVDEYVPFEWMPFKQARAFVRGLKLKSRKELRAYCESGKAPFNIPKCPNSVYKPEWISWGDFLGTGWIRINLENCLSFKKARAFVHKLNLKNEKELRAYCKSGKFPLNIPRTPSVFYKEWVSMGDWLGTGFIASKNRKYINFKKARAFARKLKLKNSAEWRTYYKSGKLPFNIPRVPSVFYKEWVSYGDWLGTEYIHATKMEFWPFKKARAFVHKLKLKNTREWIIYCKSDKKPSGIRQDARRSYKSEWVSMGDWLGTGFIAYQNRKYINFKKARAFVHKLNLKNTREWIIYCESGKLPFNIPRTPRYFYKEWISFWDWLGTNPGSRPARKKWLPFKSAQIVARKLNLKGQKEWEEWSKLKRPNNIPSHPYRVYKDEWISWTDWLGN